MQVQKKPLGGGAERSGDRASSSSRVTWRSVCRRSKRVLRAKWQTMASISQRLTALETVTSSADRTVDRVAISRLTDAELDAQIEAGGAKIRAAGGIDAFF